MKSPSTKPHNDSKSTLAAPDYDPSEAGRKEKKKKKGSTDFQHLKKELGSIEGVEQPQTPTDFLIEYLTPTMVFFMIVSLIWFLLDVRYILLNFPGNSHKFMAFLLVMGIVAMNRNLAQSHVHDRLTGFLLIYLVGFTVIYTFFMTVFETSLDEGYFAGLWKPLGFNFFVVVLVWWISNRLTRECCIDENYRAGDIGILTGTMRDFSESIRPAFKKPSLKGMSKRVFAREFEEPPTLLENELAAFEPTDLETLAKGGTVEVKVPSFAERLSSRHPGISVFYFFIPAVVIFTTGLPIIRYGGTGFELRSHLYVGLFTFAALSLLMLTSLAGLRAYFRQRRVQLPEMIGVYWVGLGLFMTAIVMLAALNVPKPALPNVAEMENLEPLNYFEMTYIHTRSQDDRDQIAKSLNQNGYVKNLSIVVIIGCVSFAAYGAVRSVLMLIGLVGRNRYRFPRWIVRFFEKLDQALQGLTQLPFIPKSTLLRIKIDPANSRSYRFQNPLRDGGDAAPIDTADYIAYSYDALCALAYDMGVPRKIDQTPFEFLEEFPKEMKPIREEAKELTTLYVKSAYSNFQLDDKVRDRVRKFWHAFESLRKAYTK